MISEIKEVALGTVWKSSLSPTAAAHFLFEEPELTVGLGVEELPEEPALIGVIASGEWSPAFGTVVLLELAPDEDDEEVWILMFCFPADDIVD